MSCYDEFCKCLDNMISKYSALLERTTNVVSQYCVKKYIVKLVKTKITYQASNLLEENDFRIFLKEMVSLL